MSNWKIQGESGRTLGASQVDVEDTTYSNMQLTRNNQAADTLTFFVASTIATQDPAYLPDFGQQISLFEGTTRRFLGYVSRPKFLLQNGVFGWQIEATHGWPELDRIALTSSDAEYTRAQGSLATTLSHIINVAIAGGARITLGSIAAMFDIPAISFRGSSCGAALAELLRIVPDAAVYFTYAGTGWPALNISRRGTMSTRTYTFGVSELIDSFSCSPVPDVTPAQVTVAYALRDSNGIVTETIQRAGTGSPKQSVVLTGANFAEFQTQAAAGQVTMQTTPMASAATWANIYAYDPKVKDIVGIPAPSTGSISVYAGSVPSDKSTQTIIGSASSAVALGTQENVVVLGEYKDWMSKLAITKGTVRLTATFFWFLRTTTNGGAMTQPAWATSLEDAGAVTLDRANGLAIYFNASEDEPNQPTTYPNGDRACVLRYSVVSEVPAISRSITTATVLRDPGDYGTASPPASLASNLLESQNFVPYEGQFTLGPSETSVDLLSQKINFAGLTARLASIGAMVQSEKIAVATGVKSVQLGLAARQGDTALSRLRKLNT
jgi:hypothetical protein